MNEPSALFSLVGSRDSFPDSAKPSRLHAFPLEISFRDQHGNPMGVNWPGTKLKAVLYTGVSQLSSRPSSRNFCPTQPPLRSAEAPWKCSAIRYWIPFALSTFLPLEPSKLRVESYMVRTAAVQKLRFACFRV
eukprot:8643050-Pyramimonas_sp.AAC.1